MKTKSHIVRVVVPAKGERPRHEYHGVMTYALGLAKEADEDDFRPAHEEDVEIQGVPANLTASDARCAVQGVIDRAGGFSLPIQWSDVEAALKEKHLELVPGHALKEADR